MILSRHLRPQVVDLLWLCGLALTIVLIYGSSLDFGLIWDDPTWYRQGVDQPIEQVVTSLPTYQFYRPLGIWLNRHLISETGVVNAPVAHAIQIGAHLAATVLSIPVLCGLGLDRRHARIAALLFALYPLSYQAVAWQAPLQPLAISGVLLAIWSASIFLRSGKRAWLGISVLAYAAALLFQESAVAFVFAFLWLAGENRRRTSSLRLWPLLHVGLAALYILIWLNVPRHADVTGRGFQPMVLGYLLQSIIYPISSIVASRVADWSPSALTGMYALGVLILASASWRWQARRATLLAIVWIAAGIIPIWAGLSWKYVELGSRLLYPASLGIAVLWAGWASRALDNSQLLWQRAAGGIVVVLVLGTSITQLGQFRQLYQIGTRHLDGTIEKLATDTYGKLLFINYPDRIEILPRLYPLGFWGLTLTPVVQNLSDYARATVGRSAEDRSLSNFGTGSDGRKAWPYRVNMRGPDSSPSELVEAAEWADMVYLTDYLPDGQLALRPVGHITSDSITHNTAIAIFGDAARLVSSDIRSMSQSTLLHTEWIAMKPLREHDTIFVHFWKEFWKEGSLSGDADGDSLGGLIPLWVWQPAMQIVDVRQVPTGSLMRGRYEITVGIYNRLNGERYPAVATDGSRFPDDEVPIGHVTFP